MRNVSPVATSVSSTCAHASSIVGGLAVGGETVGAAADGDPGGASDAVADGALLGGAGVVAGPVGTADWLDPPPLALHAATTRAVARMVAKRRVRSVMSPRWGGLDAATGPCAAHHRPSR
jgi:hypothetical protein